MTPILKVITEYCAVYVDDIRLQELSVSDPPLYARRMYNYLRPAISLFTIPVEMQSYLVGNGCCPNLMEPIYDSTSYTVQEDTTTDLIISLDSEFAGYELCACRIRSVDRLGKVYMTPIQVDYDASTAAITVPVTSTNPITQGTILDFDFYTDGYFCHELSYEIMNILGMCFQVVWQDRFNSDWLSNVSKVEDKSFYEQNRSNKMRADTERLAALRQKLAGEMRRYEQNQYYDRTISPANRLKF